MGKHKKTVTLYQTALPLLIGEEAELTKKEALRDFKGLQRGTHDGVLVIENQKPKMTGGKRKIIDESFKDIAEFKESEQGKITE